MGRVFQAEGTVYTKPGSKSKYGVLGECSIVQRPEETCKKEPRLRDLNFVQWDPRNHGSL